MANKYWKSSVASGTWSTAASWSTTSYTGTDTGGVPAAGDVVFIPAGVTIGLGTTSATCSSLQIASGAATTITGTTSTLTITGQVTGSVFTLQSNTAWSHTGTISFSNSASVDINTNAAVLACAITLAGTGTYNLLNNLTIASTKTLTHTTGSLVLNNRTLYCGLWSSTNSNTRSIAFGTSGAINTTSATASTVITYATATNFTYTGTSKFVVSGGGSSVTKTVLVGTTTALASYQVFNVYPADTSGIITYSLQGQFLNIDASACSTSIIITNSLRTIYGTLKVPVGGIAFSGNGTSATTFAELTAGPSVVRTINLDGCTSVGSIIFTGSNTYNLAGNFSGYSSTTPATFVYNLSSNGVCNVLGNVTAGSSATVQGGTVNFTGTNYTGTSFTISGGTVNFTGTNYSGTSFTNSGGIATINSAGTWTNAFSATGGTTYINGVNSWTTFTASTGSTVNITKYCTWTTFTVSGGLVNIDANIDCTGALSGTAGSIYITKTANFSNVTSSIPLNISNNGNITTVTTFILNSASTVNLYSSGNITAGSYITLTGGSAVNLYDNSNITASTNITTSGDISFYSVNSYIEAINNITLTAGTIRLLHADNLIRCATLTPPSTTYAYIYTPASTIVRNTYSAISGFPVCTLYSSKVAAWTIVNGGTGYQVNNIVTINGGTASTYALFKVTSIDASGKIIGLEINNAGQYLNIPEGTLTATGGSGTGLTLTINTWTPLFPQVGDENKRYATTVPISQQPNYFNSTYIIYKWNSASQSYTLIGDERCVLVSNSDEYVLTTSQSSNILEWTLLTVTSPSFYQFNISGRSATGTTINNVNVSSGSGNVGFEFTYTGTSTLTITDTSGYFNYKYSGSSPVTLTGLVTKTLDLYSFTGVGILSATGNINVYGSYLDNGNIFYTSSGATTKSTGSLFLKGGNKSLYNPVTFTSTTVNAPYIIEFSNLSYYRVINTTCSNTQKLTINGDVILNDATLTVNSIVSAANSSIYHTEYDQIIVTGDSAAVATTVVDLQGTTKSRDGSSGKIVLTSAGLVTTNTRAVSTSAVSNIVDAFSLTVTPLSTLINTSKDIIRFQGYYSTLDVSAHRGTSDINSSSNTYIQSFTGKPKASSDTAVVGSGSPVLTVNTILTGTLDVGNTVNAYSVNGQRYLVNSINSNNTYTVSPTENNIVNIGYTTLPTAPDYTILNVIDAPTGLINSYSLITFNNINYRISKFVPVIDGGGTGGVGKYIVYIDNTVTQYVQGSYNNSTSLLTLSDSNFSPSGFFRLPNGSLYEFISIDTYDTYTGTYILNVIPLNQLLISNAEVSSGKLTYLIAAVVQVPTQIISVGSIITTNDTTYKVTYIIEGAGYIGRYRVIEYTLIGNETVIPISGTILNALNRYGVYYLSQAGTLYSRFVISSDPSTIYYISRIDSSGFYYIDIDTSRQNSLVSGTITGNSFTLTKTISGSLNVGNYITLLTSTATGIINSIGLGSGYVSVPGVTIATAPTNGKTATATATLTNGCITAITITDKGAGYTTTPSVIITAAPAGGTSVTATAILSPDGSVIGFSTPETIKRYILGTNPINSYGALYFKTQSDYTSYISLGVHNVSQINVYGNGVFQSDNNYTSPISINVNDTVSYINSGSKHNNLTIASTATLDAENSQYLIYIAGNYTCNGKILPLGDSTLGLVFTGSLGQFNGGTAGFSENKYNSIDLSLMPINSTFNINGTYTNVNTLNIGNGTQVNIYNDANIINITNKFNSQAQLKLSSGSKLVFSNITSDRDQNQNILTNNSILIKPISNTGTSPILEFNNNIVVGSTSSITPSTTHISINDDINYYDIRKLIIEPFDSINFVYNYTGIAVVVTNMGNFFMFF